MSIYIGNLSYQVTEEDLRLAFSEYGKVSRVQLPTDRETGRPRGFAFVEMENESQETAAIEALDGAEWMGRDLRVNKAKPREERSPSRGGGGGWGNNRGGGGGGRGGRY
ncbi:RNA-binding protein [Nostoc spongiaeforme FACHB-130]|uniref:RNA-binding protein n=1 Tax=Nostoc spongiaeforme FACHB-130 TaxID=1357510 RepID=A0ABR8G5L1_9NOSO|nr:RNA-binding protein [Nostoc spongiaeforme]MBD2598434.1 RNA-binding protein [Nostoc spongiaeforme FACHB-130]